MATADETGTTTKAKATRRGFPGIGCIRCGEEDTVRVNLADVGFACSSCDSEFTVADVREMIATWVEVMAWVDSAPIRK